MGKNYSRSMRAYNAYMIMVENLEPQKMLDIGPFYGKIGMVTRQTGNIFIPQETQLDYLTLDGTPLPVYKAIFNGEVTEIQDDYDLIMALEVDEDWMLDHMDQMALHSGFIFTDARESVAEAWKKYGEAIYLDFDEDRYLFLTGRG